MSPAGRWLVVVLSTAILAGDGGCRAWRERRSRRAAEASAAVSTETPQPSPRRRSRNSTPVQRIVSLYDQKPWLNLDTSGDLDPEGIHYRVFLDTGAGQGVQRDGTFRIEVYRIDPKPSGQTARTLVSDYRYPTSAFAVVRSPTLGMGYHLRLRWGSKDIAGNEIEIVTLFEDQDGNVARSGTKRLRVPKYGA